MKEKDEKVIVKTEPKPPTGLSDRLKKEALRLPVKGGKIMLNRRNPLHRLLMEESE